MEIKTNAPGWTKCKWEDVEYEVQRESEGQWLEFMESLSGNRDIFLKCVRKIKNLKINDTTIKEPKDMLDASVPSHSKLDEFYLTAISEFRKVNDLDEEEEKNSETPPVE